MDQEMLRVLGLQRNNIMKVPNQFRLKEGDLKSNDSIGNNGCFVIPYNDTYLVAIASDGLGWDHVSVSTKGRTPTWEEMCFVKDLFFDEEESVFQIHPKRSEYVNFHKYCLHLWRPQNVDIPLPSSILVGPK